MTCGNLGAVTSHALSGLPESAQLRSTQDSIEACPTPLRRIRSEGGTASKDRADGGTNDGGANVEDSGSNNGGTDADEGGSNDGGTDVNDGGNNDGGTDVNGGGANVSDGGTNDGGTNAGEGGTSNNDGGTDVSDGGAGIDDSGTNDGGTNANEGGTDNNDGGTNDSNGGTNVDDGGANDGGGTNDSSKWLPCKAAAGQTASSCASKNCASKAHTDNDHCLSGLSVTAKGSDDSAPVQSFVFPAHNICVPSFTLGIAAFDPHQVHRASNPKDPETSIHANRVLAKTINLAAAGQRLQPGHSQPASLIQSSLRST